MMSMVKCEECDLIFDSDIDCDCFNDFDEAVCENCRDDMECNEAEVDAA